jgi:hypothetical protein
VPFLANQKSRLGEERERERRKAASFKGPERKVDQEEVFLLEIINCLLFFQGMNRDCHDLLRENPSSLLKLSGWNLISIASSETLVHSLNITWHNKSDHHQKHNLT